MVSHSDNVRQEPRGLEESDTFMEVSPYFMAHSSHPRARYDVFYQMRNFYRFGEGEATLFRHAMRGTGTFMLDEEHLGVDLSGFMASINASPEGPLSVDPSAAFANTAKVRQFTVSPWLRNELGRVAEYDLRYSAARSGGDSRFTLADLEQRVSAGIGGLPRSTSGWNWRASSEFESQRFDGGITQDRRHSRLGLLYRARPDLVLSGGVDYEQIDDVIDKDGNDSGYGPFVGFDWNPGVNTSASATVSRRYYGTVGDARLSHRTRRTTFGITYSRAVVTSASQSLLFLNPEALVGGRLDVLNPDPVLARLIATGLVSPLDPSLPVGTFTDAAIYQRRTVAFFGLHGARNSVTLAASRDDRRSAYAAADAVADIIAEAAAGNLLAGKVRERTWSVNYQHRFDPRSAVDLTFERRTIASTTADFDTHLNALTLFYRFRFTAATAAFAGFRRMRQTASALVIGTTFDENTFFVGFDMRFL